MESPRHPTACCSGYDVIRDANPAAGRHSRTTAQAVETYHRPVDRFPDRFNSEAFAADEPVELRAHSQEVGTGTFLPEGLFARLRALGIAYDLHILADLITPYEAVELNRPQVESLLAEIEFVAAVVNDPIVIEAVTLIQPVLAAAARAGGGLIIDWDI